MSESKLELFYFTSCPFCQVVLKAIDQLKIKDKIIFLDIHSDQSALDRLVNDTGRRTVPCLYIDNKPMHESRDIVAWLETKFS